LKADPCRLLDAETLRLLGRRLGPVDGDALDAELRCRTLLKGPRARDRCAKQDDNKQSGMQAPEAEWQ
jgi:hypothetical protein